MTIQGEPAVTASSVRAVQILKEWIRTELPDNLSDLVTETLRQATAATAASGALFVWEDTEEPWLYFSFFEGGDVTTSQEMSTTYNPVVAEELREIAFISKGDENRVSVLRGYQIDDLEMESGEAINSRLMAEHGLSNALVVPIRSAPVDGHLFLRRVENPESVLPLAEMIGAIAGNRLSLREMITSTSVAAVERQMTDIARDLHDGVLQSFTGVVLQLETLHQLIEDDPQDARDLITQLQSVLMGEQRDLRSYLEQIRPKRTTPESEFDLTQRFRELERRYRDEWSIELTLDRTNVSPVILRAIGWETYRILVEAINNAARHGRAGRIDVELTTRGDMLCIRVQDDGEGFDFRGRLGIDELSSKGTGPRSLMERVSGLNGELFVESTDEGSLIEARIPVGWGG